MSWKQFFAFGIIIRLAFLFSYPNLSDDYFRFIWDGHLLLNGLNPYSVLPTEVQLDFPNKEYLLANMNSPNYYSVYPPITQLIYALASWMSPNSILGNVVALRLILVFSEVLTFFGIRAILTKIKLHSDFSLLYFLNPLVVIEFTGNLHFEAFVILFLTYGVLLFYNYYRIFTSILWSIAIGIKLIPFLLLPAFIRKMNIKSSLGFYLTATISTAIIFYSLFDPKIASNFFSSINLYFETFEFNASIYYLIREMGYWIVGYNPIKTVGPILSKLALLFLFVLQVGKWKYLKSVFEVWLFSLLLYYLFASIVHPWYIGYLVFFAIFSKFRFPIVWSFLAFLSYAAYANETYQENYLLIGIEYGLLLGIIFYELYNRKMLFANLNK